MLAGYAGGIPHLEAIQLRMGRPVVMVIVIGFLLTEKQKQQETQKKNKKNNKQNKNRRQRKMKKKKKNTRKNGKNTKVPLDLAKSAFQKTSVAYKLPGN